MIIRETVGADIIRPSPGAPTRVRRVSASSIAEDNGTVHAGEIVLSLGGDFDIAIANADGGDVLASFAQPLGI
ncbi:MAG: hypothetical protein LBR71_02010 [Synergistaceae bacterium]|nr:hypothetical protein [Synergistaceae bacterium]